MDSSTLVAPNHIDSPPNNTEQVSNPQSSADSEPPFNRFGFKAGWLVPDSIHRRRWSRPCDCWISWARGTCCVGYKRALLHPPSGSSPDPGLVKCHRHRADEDHPNMHPQPSVGQDFDSLNQRCSGLWIHSVRLIVMIHFFFSVIAVCIFIFFEILIVFEILLTHFDFYFIYVALQLY